MVMDETEEESKTQVSYYSHASGKRKEPRVDPFPTATSSSTTSNPSPKSTTDGFIELQELPSASASKNKRKLASLEKALDPASKSFEDAYIPWMKNGERYSSDNIFLRLHEEILDFVTFISPTEDEIQRRKDVQDEMNILVQEIWPEANIRAFGSTSTGMFLPDSDIDMVIFGSPTDKSALHRLGSFLREKNVVSYLEVIDKARVPIVKITHERTQLHIDISFGVDSGLIGAELIKSHVRLNPAFRPLTLLLKYFLNQRKLNITFQGGMGSFLLQMMVISFLQQYVKASESYECQHMYNLGHLLVGFLKLYGKDFGYDEVAISIREGGSYFIKSSRQWYNPDRPHLISVENPHDLNHDIGKNSYDIRRIVRVFEYAHMTLISEIQLRGKFPKDRRYHGSLLHHILHVDEPLKARVGPTTLGYEPVDYVGQSSSTSSTKKNAKKRRTRKKQKQDHPRHR